jgi:hypothetical protein
MRRSMLLLFALSFLALPAGALGATTVAPGGGTPDTASNFRLVGHEPLFNRGMNAALAIYREPRRHGHAARRSGRGAARSFVYVGNRTDGATPNHIHPGILVVDTTHPEHPKVVNEIGPPYASQPGITTRELRVWPQKKLLMVMTFRCSSVIHDCVAPDANDPRPADEQFPYDIKFFSLEDPVHPRFIESYVPTSQAGEKVKPHEMFLWADPHDANRALLWISTPSASTDPKRPQMMIVDLSHVPHGGPVTEVAEGNWNNQFEAGGDPAAFDDDLSVHSMAPTPDGRLTHMAYLRGEYLALDTSSVVDNEQPGVVQNLNNDLITRPENRPRWGTGDNCPGHTSAGCSESHSSIQVPGRPYVFNIDEVYGAFTAPSFGWPWAWARLIDVHDLAHPRIVGEYKLFEQTEAGRAAKDDPATEMFTSYGSHNPTILPRLVIDAWHSGGLQAIDISNPATPQQAGWYSPKPLPAVATEDPALNRGPNKVTIWSYPIIRNGLIYVVDIRNGLYILKYTGRQMDEVKAIRFLEGNSNLGDAARLARGGQR